MTNTKHTWTETTERRYNEALNCIPPFKQFSDCFFIGEMTEGTTAEEVATQCGYLDEMPEHLRCYFDFDAFGHDLEIEGTFDYCQELRSYIEFMN